MDYLLDDCIENKIKGKYYEIDAKNETSNPIIRRLPPVFLIILGHINLIYKIHPKYRICD